MMSIPTVIEHIVKEIPLCKGFHDLNKDLTLLLVGSSTVLGLTPKQTHEILIAFLSLGLKFSPGLQISMLILLLCFLYLNCHYFTIICVTYYLWILLHPFSIHHNIDRSFTAFYSTFLLHLLLLDV
jgi:hypothetical protein